MPDYIVIDRMVSGHIAYDTRTLPADHVIDGKRMGDVELTPALACQWGDETQTSERGRFYINRRKGYRSAHYDVYDAGDLPVVEDESDPATIKAVLRGCKYAGTIEAADIKADY